MPGTVSPEKSQADLKGEMAKAQHAAFGGMPAAKLNTDEGKLPAVRPATSAPHRTTGQTASRNETTRGGD
jgi:hypothetical protein